MLQPAILRGTQEPLITDPALSLLGSEEREALLRAFDACMQRGGRELDEVEQFEQQFAAHFGLDHAVAVCSATAGLQVALQAFGIGEGDEVLVPPYTFAATAHAVLHAGATPVFADIERETLCLDPDAVARRIGPRTRAMIVVHIGGKPARMPALLDVARAHGLVVIEDAAQAHGATYAGRPVGTFGDAGVFSFSPKLMTSFRGGIVLLGDPDAAERCRRLRFHGLPGNRNKVRVQRQFETGSAPHFVHHEAGYSLAMTPLQAALLVPQLAHLEARCAHRHANGAYVADRLARIPGLHPVRGCPEGRSNFYMLEVCYDPAGFSGLTRDDVVTALTWEGVPVSPTAVTKMLAYDNPSLEAYRDERCPVAEEVLERLLIFGHPLQSLAFQGDRPLLDRIADAVERVQLQADLLAAHFGTACA